jgi:uncharacterized protein with PIN domain
MSRQWEHNPIGQVTGAPVAAGRPDAYAWEKDGTQHIVYRGTDNQIHEIWSRRTVLNTKWAYGGALSSTVGAPAANSDPSGYVWESDGSQHIVYLGTDNQIHEIFQKDKGLMGKKWEHGGAITSAAGAPAAAGKPYAYAWESDKSQHIIYRGTDNNIHELWFEHGTFTSGSWKYGGAINAKVSAPAAAGDPIGFAWEHDKTQHIVYLGVDGQIHELFFRDGWVVSQWKYEGGLTGRLGAPNAVSNPSAYSWEHDGSQHIIYRAADNEIHEIFYKKKLASAKWEYGGAISARTGAVPGVGDPYGYAWEDDKTQHIIYRTEDGGLHELWYRDGLGENTWKYGGALTRVANAPAAATDPVAFAWEKDGTQHVVYRGQDGSVQELWYRK